MTVKDYSWLKEHCYRTLKKPCSPSIASEHLAILDLIKEHEERNCVLDKIRAEIKQEYNRLSATRADETLELGECLGLKMSLKIIDKYKAESEVRI